MSNTKSNTNIDWDFHRMIKGKCTGTGCPIRKTCERFTSQEFDKAYGYIKPPHDSGGYFPKICLNFLSNAAHKPALKTFDVQY